MSFDAIVVGGGPNGLAAAAVLARSGRKTLVLEGRDHPGGLCAGETFHPGYRHVGVHHDTDTVRPWVVEHLGLERYGASLVDRPPLWLPAPPGGDPAAGLLLPDQPERAAPELAADWKRWRALVAQVRPVVAELIDAPAPRLGHDAPVLPLLQQAFAVRRAGAPLIRELMRIVPASVEDGLADVLTDRRVRAGVALGGLIGAFMGPRSPQSAGLVLIREALASGWIHGGPAKLAEALGAAARAAGVEVRCGAVVERIRIERGQVRGVLLRGGEPFDAPIVVSAVDPKRTLLELVGAGELPLPVEDQARAVRVRATSAKLHLALSRAPRLGERDTLVERVRIAFDPNHLERAFDDAKHRRLPEMPALDVRIPTVSDPSLAPTGHHVLSIHVFGVPYAPASGWGADVRAQLLESVVGLLARLDPELPSAVVGAELLDPPELEARYGVSGGHLMHAEHALDQLWVMRPGLGLSGHATPVRGLFLGSGGTHPYGWPGGAAGVGAARVAAEEQ